MKKILFFIILFSMNTTAGEIFFLPRVHEEISQEKYRLSIYYSNRNSPASCSTDIGDIEWNYQWQGIFLQPSLCVGENTNIHVKLGMSDIIRQQSTTNTKQEGNLGNNIIYGFGIDYKAVPETTDFPAIDINFGLATNSYNLSKTIWYEPDGTKHESNETTSMSMSEMQLGLILSKKFNRITISGGLQKGFVNISDSGAFMLKSKNDMFMLIPSNEYFSDDITKNKDYYDSKYPDYIGKGLLSPATITTTNIQLSTKLDVFSDSSIIIELLAGKEIVVSLGYSMVFKR